MDNNSAGSTIPEKNADASKNGGKITHCSLDSPHPALAPPTGRLWKTWQVWFRVKTTRLNSIRSRFPVGTHFTVNNLSYHGQDLSIVWNNDGTYNAPKGYTLYVDGNAVFTSDKLAHLIYDPARWNR